MKRFILPLMLLLLVGSLFAVESAPSEVVGYVKYDCVTGLNFVALPMDQGYIMASDLGTAYSGLIDQISYWDASLQDWTTASDLGFMWDGDFEVGNGSPVMISCVSDVDVYSIGELFASLPVYSLQPGLNAVMVPLNRSDLAMAGDLGLEMGADQVSTWDPALQDWATASDLGFMWDGDFELSIGMAILTSVYDSSTWPTRNVRVKSNLSTSK